MPVNDIIPSLILSSALYQYCFRLNQRILSSQEYCKTQDTCQDRKIESVFLQSFLPRDQEKYLYMILYYPPWLQALFYSF